MAQASGLPHWLGGARIPIGAARLGYEWFTGSDKPTLKDLSDITEGAAPRQTATQVYRAERDRLRRDIKAAKEQYPGTYFASAIGGGAALPVGNILKAATIPAQMKRGALFGAGYGGLSGFGAGEGLEDSLGNIPIGAGVGGAAGYAAPRVIEAIADGVNALSTHVGHAWRGRGAPPAETARRVTQELERDAESAVVSTKLNPSSGAAPGEFQTAKAGASGVPSSTPAAPASAPASTLSTVHAPVVFRPDRPMFDYTKLHEVPNVRQFDLPRYDPPRGVPTRTFEIESPANIERVRGIAGRGAKMGGLEWSNTEPLREYFIAELGHARGQAAFQTLMDEIAGASALATVPDSIRIGAFYNNLISTGQPLPRLVKDGNHWRLAEPLPHPYGHIAQVVHRRNIEDVLQHGGLLPLRTPKAASMAENAKGNLQPIPIDKRHVHTWGLRDTKGNLVDAPARTQVHHIEQLEKELAREMGITPGQLGNSIWAAGGGHNEPLLRQIENAIERTAYATGLSKYEILRRLAWGDVRLLSAAGFGAGVGTGSFEDSQAERHH
jgi:hypothetical protein